MFWQTHTFEPCVFYCVSKLINVYGGDRCSPAHMIKYSSNTKLPNPASSSFNEEKLLVCFGALAHRANSTKMNQRRFASFLHLEWCLLELQRDIWMEVVGLKEGFGRIWLMAGRSQQEKLTLLTMALKIVFLRKSKPSYWLMYADFQVVWYSYISIWFYVAL